MVEKASSYVSVSSVLAPKFRNLLENGCFGNASKIGPLVVPLAKVVRENSKEKEKIDREVIDALCHGLANRSVSYSPMESTALSASLFQLLESIGTTTKDDSHIGAIFQASVSNDKLI